MKSFSNLIIFSLLTVLSIHAQPGTEANKDAIVISGNARFTVLTPELIRMEWSEDGQFEDLASLIFTQRDLIVPSFKKTINNNWLIITTDKLTLRYKLNTGKFISNNLSVSFMLNGIKQLWNPGMKDIGNLKGTYRTLDGYDGPKQAWSKQYLPFENGIISRSGWVLVNDSMPLFDGSVDWNWVTPRKLKDFQDWYFFGYGHNYAKALYDFTQVAGKIPMPPRFAFGYWWSRYWSYSDSEMRELITDIKDNDIPIDVAVIDMDWHRIDAMTTRNGFNNSPKDIMGQVKDWGGYTWNKELFPNPKLMLDWMDENKIKNALNIHPASGVLRYDDYYPAMAKALGLDTTKATPYDKSFGKISGWDTISVGNNIPWDITNKKFAKAYFDVIIRDFEKQGIDFWWLDWQQWLQTPMKNLNNTCWLNYCFFTDMERNRYDRPLLFHRWGGLGNHRYQIGFSGDTFSSWSSLDFQKEFTSTAANVGYGYWSHDIGGHIQHDEYNPELYTRWVQYGVFSPILRTHGTKKPQTDRRIWAYPFNNYVQMKKAIQLRYALLPYIYTASRITYDSGLSICLPLYFKHPEDEMAYQNKQMYYFGENMIVSPVSDSIRATNLLAPSTIWLPEGKWFDCATGEMLEGKKFYNRAYSLGQIPVFMKAGSIIPMYPPIQNTQNLPETLILSIVPGEKGSMRFYDDAGNDNEYKGDNYCWINAKHNTEDNQVDIIIYKPEGKYKTHVKNYSIRLLNTLPALQATYNGNKLKIKYDAQTLTTEIQIPNYDMGADGKINVKFKDNIAITQQWLNGLKGKMEALNEIMPKLKEYLGAVDLGPMSSHINNLSQTAIRIGYSFENADMELNSFAKGFVKIENEIEAMKLDDRGVRPLINRIKNCYISKPIISVDGFKSIDKPVKVKIEASDKEGEIFYTIDGSVPTPNSILYTKPLEVATTTTVKAVFVKDGIVSELVSDFFYFIPVKSISCNTPHFGRFLPPMGFSALMDNVIGNPKTNGENWVGMDKDFSLTIELITPQSLSEIKIGVLQDKWIVALPSLIEVFVSADGKNYTSAGSIKPDIRVAIEKGIIYREELLIKVNQVNAKYVQLRFKTAGVLPSNHAVNPGKSTLIFMDEISIK
jgi:alpha-glucosidase (family GH31 glycosyl hydrolase)